MTTHLAYYPPDYQEWLFAALDLAPGEELAPGLLEPLYRFQHAWVGEGNGGGLAYDAALVRAYTAFYMTINLPKLWFMLDRAAPALQAALASDRPLTVVELGCGPGTFLWSLLLYLLHHQPEALSRVAMVRGVDTSPEFLAVAARLGAGLARWPALRHLRCEWRQADWRTLPDEPADVLILGNTLQEQPALPAGWVERLAARLLLVVEPGTRDSFRRVLPLRDQLLTQGWQIAFPCPRPAPCPLAADNWCHFHVNRLVLPYIQRMCGHAGRLNPRHHFTGLLCQRGPVAATGPGQVWRVMSTLRRANRSGIRYLCDGEHLVEAVVNRHVKGPATEPFFAATPGDALRLQRVQGAGPLHRTGKVATGDVWTVESPHTAEPQGPA